MGESTEDDQMNGESDEGEWEEMEIGKSPGPNRDGTPDHGDPLCSYTIIGDKVDKNVKPRDMRALS